MRPAAGGSPVRQRGNRTIHVPESSRTSRRQTFRRRRPDAVSGAQQVRDRFHSPRREVLRSEEHTSELQSRLHLVCRLLLEKKKNIIHWPATIGHISLQPAQYKLHCA